MRHRGPLTKSTTTPLLSVDVESRSRLAERSSTLEYQHNLAILEEDWQNSQQQMGTPSSISSSVFDLCRCCGRQDCENLDYFNRHMKKLESDTRLAAEIGQGLLHKHETFVNESNQQKLQLEKQLEECHERITGLEQSLDDVENEKDDITKEKNKWRWEYQKRQKILDETISDLEMANEKYNQTSIELESKSSEIDKLRIFKFMVRHSETREETLRSKLVDTNQELAVCRKNELVLESKIKKLKMRYETLYNTHKQLSKDVEENMNTTLSTHVNNNTTTNTNNNNTTIIQNDAMKLVSSNNNNNTNDLINIIKELSSANTKLKSDLLNTRDQLSEAKSEVNSLLQKIDDNESGADTKKLSLRDDLKKKESIKENKGLVKRAASVIEKKQQRREDGVPVPIKSKTAVPPITTSSSSSTTATNVIPLPTVSSSMPTHHTGISMSSSPSSMNHNGNNPIVHHHYHYYVKNSKGERIKVTGDDIDSSSSSMMSENVVLDCCNTTEKNDLYSAAATSNSLYPQHNNNHSENMILSPSTSSIITIKDGTVVTTTTTESPYKLLREHVLQVLDRLRGSDIRALNRKLKRAFDITELSSMSNSVIDNILMDIETLESRFLWAKNTSGEEVENEHMLAFFPLLELLKDMLKELGILRTTMNELQVEYVKKVEESEIRVEEEIIRKRQLKNTEHTMNNNNNNTKPFTWLTNMFYKSNDDRGSTLTKTTTNASTLITSLDEEDSLTRKEDLDNTTRPSITRLNRQQQQNRKSIPSFPTVQQPITILKPSKSIGTTTASRSSPSIPIIRKKRSSHRMHIDYEGIGPASIRPIHSDHRDSTTAVVNFSSSWLGGK